MCKKTITYFTLIAFIVFTVSCSVYTTKKKRAEDVVGLEGKKVRILAVLTTSGEHIEFPKHRPGRISGAYIVGTTDSAQYVSIPLSEVELAWVRRVDPALTFVATLGGIAVTYLAIGLIVMLMKESCPFIYSFDGEQYIFDAEPYGGAICQGLKRTEWCRLDNLKEVNGHYKIMITNEVDETQYTDEIRLIVVDHPKEAYIVPDVTGGIHTFSQALSPYRAYDGKGKDLMPRISKNDWKFWQTSTEDKNPDREEDLRDELYFEFPKPQGANTAKLLVNACTTLWGSQMLKRFLDLLGNRVGEWYDEVNNFGPAYHRLNDSKGQAERYLLQIRVETRDGWKTKGLIMGGGPFISKDKAYLLDVSDVAGDTLKIKLTPPATFWMINYLAVDYSEDLPIRIAEIEAWNAVDWKGQDVREALAYNDNNYLIMPNIGDKAELTFQSLPQFNDMERSIILKASGYYDIHLKAEGEPKNDIIRKFFVDPEYMNKYAFKEYLKWKKENMENLKRK